MSLVTLDPYYSVEFYNQTRESLTNNGVKFREFISTKPPFHFFLEVPDVPTFIDYDRVPKTYSRWLVNIVQALKPNDDYIYRRREGLAGPSAVALFAVNDALRAVQKTGEGVFFTSTRDRALEISRLFPRKIWWCGRYYSGKYRVFLSDSLLIKNFLRPDDVLVQSKKFKSVLELEVELNVMAFQERDRLVKMSQTPYLLDGKLRDLTSVRPEIGNKFVLS